MEFEKDGSALDRFLSLQATDDREADLLMTITGKHNGRSLPYTIEINLNAPFDDYAQYKRAFVGKKWDLESGDKSKAKQLKKLKLPNAI